MNCICGHNQSTTFTKPDGVFIGPEGEKEIALIELAKCLECGIVRQVNIPFSTEQEYRSYYKNDYPPVTDAYTKKTYGHDRDVARLRSNAYSIKKGTGRQMILDVGSGSGAFVDECRDRNKNAFGCEISKYAYAQSDEFIYRDRLEDIHFPTDYFDVVTCHDIVEHVLNPVEFVAEMFRITKQEGTCIIDMPRFFHESGKHHWKSIEHIWFFNEDQFKKILKSAGFNVLSIKNPIESKIVFYVTKPIQERTKILFPPGMGDSLWPLMKLQSFMKDNNIKPPVDAYIVCPKDRKYNGHKRSVPFLELFPFVKSTGIVHTFGDNPIHKKLWKTAYSKSGQTVFPDVLDCDYFISYNGHTIGKRTLQGADKYKCNWFPPMFVSLEQMKYQKQAVKKYGKYLLLYFPFYGMYRSWATKFSCEKFAESINKIIDYTGYTPIFVGSRWDKDDTDCAVFRKSIKGVIDLTSKTTTDQVFGLIKGSQGMLVFPSGLSIVATVFKQNVMILWDDHWKDGRRFAENFAKRCCPPSTVGNTYQYKFVGDLTVPDLVESSVKLFTGKRVDKKRMDRIVKKHKPKTVKKVNKPINYPSIAVICILKAGDGHSSDDVVKLKNMIARNSTIPHEFYCLTNVDNFDPDICNIIRLRHGYGRRWSNIEMFRDKIVDSDYMVYFDLGAVVVGNIDDILIPKEDFMALKPWNRLNRLTGLFASGMMSWKNGGTYSFIYDKFTDKDMSNCKSDQDYITRSMKNNNKGFVFFQDRINGIYSYKKHCKNELPPNARIICFHGKPKPGDVPGVSWIKENWV